MVNSYQLHTAIDALHTGANTYTQAADELRTLSNRLTSTAQELASGADRWAGQGAQAFQVACQRYQSAIQRANISFEAIAPILRTLAQALEDALWTKTEIERLDPLNALLRLGRSIPFGFGTEAGVIEHEIVEVTLQAVLEETLMAADAIASNALETIMLADIAQQAVSPIYDQLPEYVGWAGSVAGDLASISKVLRHDIKGVPGGLLTLFTIASDFISGKTHDFRTLGSDTIGGLIGVGVATDPIGAVIEGVAGAVNLLSLGGELEQNIYASQFSGILGTELKDPASNLGIAASNANIGAVFDDVGKLVIDSDGAIGNPVLLSGIVAGSYALRIFGVNVPGEVDPTTLASDYGDLFMDTGRPVLSPVQLVVNVEAARFDDNLVNIDKSLQNLPVPSNVKTSFDTFTPIAIKYVNDYADFFTKQDIKKVRSNVWNWITN